MEHRFCRLFLYYFFSKTKVQQNVSDYALSCDLKKDYTEYPSVADIGLTICGNKTRKEVRLHRDGEEKTIYIVDEISNGNCDYIEGNSLKGFYIIWLPLTLKSYLNLDWNRSYFFEDSVNYVAKRNEKYKH